jgi:hypothetical protein
VVRGILGPVPCGGLGGARWIRSTRLPDSSMLGTSGMTLTWPTCSCTSLWMVVPCELGGLLRASMLKGNACIWWDPGWGSRGCYGVSRCRGEEASGSPTGLLGLGKG